MADRNKKGEKTVEKDINLEEIQGWLEELPSFEDEAPKKESSTEEFLKTIKEKLRNGQNIKDDGVLLDKIAFFLQEESNKDRINELFDILKDAKIEDATFYSRIGMSAYELKNYIVAERAYRLAVEHCVEEYLIIGYKNNLAYLIRRKEIENPDNRSEKEVPVLLRDGVAKKDTFSLINMALFWALEHGNRDNWELADKLVSYVNKSDISGAFEWWKEVALADEAEGYLVHLLLMRHGKIGSSSLGSIEKLFDRVKKDYPGIPDSMKNIVTPFDSGEFDDFPPFPSVDWE